MATYHVDNNLYDGHAAGVCQDGGGNTTVKLAAGASGDDDAYSGYGINVWKTSDGSNIQRLRCTAYNGTTKIATVNANWPIENPDSNYSYEITVGSDANTGASEGTGSTGAWRTLQKAMNEVAAGDTVWVKVGRAHTDDDDGDGYCAEIQTAGGTRNPVSFIGYKSSKGDAGTYRAAHPELRPSDPSFDDYRVVLDGDAGNLERGFSTIINKNYYIFENFRATRFSSGGFYGSGVPESLTYRNCRSHLNLIIGFYTGKCCWFEDCCSDNNTINGIHGGGTVLNCDVHNNGQIGIAALERFVVLFSRIYENGYDAFNAIATVSNHVVCNNTFVGKDKAAGKKAIALPDYEACETVINNIIHDFDIGIWAASDLGAQCVVRNNLFTNVNTPRVNFPEGMGDIEASDPKFVDEANGDYRLRFDSPARGAGCPPCIDIGAEQRKEIATHSPTDVGVQT